jgi:hypothetical protein
VTARLDELRQATADLKAASASECERLAVELLGAPSKLHSNRRNLRWGRHGGLSLMVTGKGKGRWSDFSTGESGNLIDLAMLVLGDTFEAACDWLRDRLGGSELLLQAPAKRDRDEPDPDLEVRVGKALRWFREAKPGVGTLAERYLTGRGLDVPPGLWGDVARFHPRVPFLVGDEFAWHPALIFVLRSFVGAEATGIHKIALGPDGRAIRKADGRKLKVSSAGVKGSAIMLGSSAEVTTAVTIAEGAETGIGIIMGDWGLPVWSAAGAGFIRSLEPIAGIEHLVIGADNDVNGTGVAAARCCADRWCEAGRSVEIRWPVETGTDFADLYARNGGAS